MIGWRGRRLLALALLAALVVAAGSVGPSMVRAAVRTLRGAVAYDQPGELATLPDHRKLNLQCIGRGRPTVILESGFAANAGAWTKVQPLVARTTRVCAYDRAGYGFSDPGPLPRDGAAIARDLDRGLRSAQEQGPFILVGHSAGGLYVRLLAARRLSNVVGLIFVDPSVEYQDRRYAAAFGPGVGSVEGIRQRVLKCAVAMEAKPADDADREACAPRSASAHDRAVALRPQTWRSQVSEIETLFTSTSDQVTRVGDLLKDVPAVVLTATPTGLPAGADDPGGQVWQGLHRELASRFIQGEQRLVKSSHLIMIDRPEVVAAEIKNMVDATRGSNSRQKAASRRALPE
jgi:pimeloyl-ACP methyl ester carboxylesterase